MATPAPDRTPAMAWIMVGVATIAWLLGFGAIATPTVFLTPVAEAFAAPRGQIAFSYTLAALAAGLAGLAVGYAANRFRVRSFALLGALAMGGALCAASFAQAPWQLHILYAVLGGLGYATITAPLLAAAAGWMPRNPGLAIGIVTAGGAAGQGLVPLIARFLISASDWRGAYLQLGIAYLLVGVPLAFLIREAPARPIAATAASGQAAVSLLSPAAVIGWIGVASIFCCICMAVPIMHIVALVTDRGLPPEVGASVLTLLMVFGAIGRVIAGRLCDVWGALPTYLLLSLGQAVLVYPFMLPGAAWGFYLVAIGFGLFYAGVMTCLIAITRELLPPSLFVLGVGAVFVFAWSGMGLGGVLGGVLFDRSGSYHLSYAAAALAGAINLCILLLLRRRLAVLGRRATAIG